MYVTSVMCTNFCFVRIHSVYKFIVYMNSYIHSNFATEDAADIELVAAADDTIATDAAYSASGVEF
jgi:hypothetical protein